MKKPISAIWTILGVNIILLFYMVWVPWQTQDGPNHKLVATFLAHFQDQPEISEIYRTHLSPLATNQIFPRVYSWLEGLLTINQYEKVFVFTALSLLLWSYYLFLKIYSPRSKPYWVVALPILFHLLFIQGMYNFTLSISLTLSVMILFELGVSRGGFWPLLGFLLLSWLSFLAHPFPFFIIGLTLLFRTIFSDSNVRIKTLPYWVIASFFFLWGFILPLFSPATSQGAEPFSYKLPWETLGGIIIKSFPAFSVWQLLGFAPFALLLIYLAVQSIKRSPGHLKIFWMAMLVLYFIFPNAGKGGAHLNIRFLLYVWLFLPLGLDISRPMSKLVPIICMVTAIYAGGTVSWAMHQTQKRADLVKKAYRSLPNGVRVFPINFNIYGPGLNYTAWMHLWAQFPENKTLFTPYLFAQSNLMPLSYRNDAVRQEFPAPLESLANEILLGEHCTASMSEKECQTLADKTWLQLLATAQHFDYLWLHEPPSSFIQLINNQDSFTKVYSQGPLSLWKIH